MARVCVDACFLIGLYDRDDQHHALAVSQFDALFGEESRRHIRLHRQCLLIQSGDAGIQAGANCFGGLLPLAKASSQACSLSITGRLLLKGELSASAGANSPQLSERAVAFWIVQLAPQSDSCFCADKIVKIPATKSLVVRLK
jgi:hypothetical protein